MDGSSSANETAAQHNLGRKRGCLFDVIRALKWFGIILVALIVLGVAYQTIATELDNRYYAPRGELYSVNGHQMHIVCMGEGGPTVILEGGATAESLWWYWVQQHLSQHTQVCAYDRAGLGWSEIANGSRDPLTIAGDLHLLLQEAGIPGPYVMVGHSFGAVWVRVFASQYPEEVSGIALVDSTVIPGESDYPSWKTFNDVVQTGLWALTRAGVLRLAVSGQFRSSGYPADIAQELAAQQARNQTFDTTYAETIAAMPGFIEAAAPAANLGELPMMVLWAGAGPMGGEHLADVRTAVAGYSSNSATRVIAGADHGSILGYEAYAQQVTDAILDVIEAVQMGEPLAQ